MFSTHLYIVFTVPTRMQPGTIQRPENRDSRRWSVAGLLQRWNSGAINESTIVSQRTEVKKGRWSVGTIKY